jgi:hypothetical protein
VNASRHAVMATDRKVEGFMGDPQTES